MIGRLAGSWLFWILAIAGLAVGLYLAFAVFGVQTLFLNEEVTEEFQAGAESTSAEEQSEEVVSSGQFHGVAHPGTGDAIVYRLGDGSRVLRLENLDIFNGPDLYVYAVAAPDANDDATVLDAGFLNLGQLKGNRGDQTYELPADFDPERHRSISVWCQRFSVNFASAPLS